MTQLRTARDRRGWSQSQLMAELRAAARSRGQELPADGTLRSMISRWETGRHEPSAMYRHLFDAVYDTGAAAGDAAAVSLRSHQFVPAWIGPDAASSIATVHALKPARAEWIEPQHRGVSGPSAEATCELHVWPHGVVIFHIVDELSFPSLASLALWREQTYDERLTWATGELRPIAPDAQAAYVLSLYWLDASDRSGPDHETQMRIICMPEILLDRHLDEPDDESRHTRARLTEDDLLASRWNHPEIRPFGVAGTSCAYASWSGVVYQAQAPARALTEPELVEHELAIQSTWTYCAHLSDAIEQGRDPVVPGEWGWRYLRAMRCRLTNPRPQEPPQHRSMREAILETSALVGHLDQALDALRELVR